MHATTTATILLVVIVEVHVLLSRLYLRVPGGELYSLVLGCKSKPSSASELTAKLKHVCKNA